MSDGFVGARGLERGKGRRGGAQRRRGQRRRRRRADGAKVGMYLGAGQKGILSAEKQKTTKPKVIVLCHHHKQFYLIFT